jgi:hypothetical protein
MNRKSADDQFSEKEAQQRFEAALRGARIAGHKSMESMTPKRSKSQSKKRRKEAAK